MALKMAARGVQRLQCSEFIGSFNDTVVDVNGVQKSLGSVFGDMAVFETNKLPVGAVIEGGSLIVETAGAGPAAYTLALGIRSNPTAFLAATDLKTPARTAIGGLGLTANAGDNVIATINSTTANATAGKFRVRIMFTIDNKADEVITA